MIQGATHMFDGRTDEAVIRYAGVRKSFGEGAALAPVIDGLDFEVRRGEYLCIIGSTGSGKSTTLNLMLGLLAASAGEVRVLGFDPSREFQALRGRLGCIFQGDRLLPWRSALDNVRLPLEILGIDERTLAVTPLDWLARVGLGESAQAFPHQLSGGMRQRVAMARALVSDPEIVLADEAFGHLDEVTGHRLKTDFKQVAREAGKTVVHVTHSIDEAVQLADRILLLGRHGRVFASFRPDRELAGSEGVESFKRRIYSQIELSSQIEARVAESA